MSSSSSSKDQFFEKVNGLSGNFAKPIFKVVILRIHVLKVANIQFSPSLWV